MPDRKKQNGPIVPESVCPKCGLVHGAGELCTRFALNLAFDGSEAQAPPPPPVQAPSSGPATEPGQVSRRGYFHHYRIACHPDGMLWELGSGAMGITYKAHDERLKLDVALKVINQTFMNDRGAQTLFLREARAAARVRHSNVASVLFLNDAPGNVFYAMEFVAGEPLNAWLKREGKIVPLVAIDIAKQLASGLGAIHAEGLIHRDLKPANVLLQPAANTATTADGTSFAHRSALRVKIIDFGVAREIATEVDAVSTIGFRGTVAYASPEQCEEHYDLDGRSDLYSLGCILFEMLAGHPPFAARSRRAFLNLHVTEPPPLHLLDDQPAILVAVIARLLAKNPEERYQDAQALVEALDAAEEKIDRIGSVATAGGKRGSPLKVVSKWIGRARRKMRGDPSLRHGLPGQTRRKSRAGLIWFLVAAAVGATAAALLFPPAGRDSGIVPGGRRGRQRPPRRLQGRRSRPAKSARWPFCRSSMRAATRTIRFTRTACVTMSSLNWHAPTVSRLSRAFHGRLIRRETRSISRRLHGTSESSRSLTSSFADLAMS